MKEVATFLNKVRETASDAYQTSVPIATATNITEVGHAVLGLPSIHKNEFIEAVNKIITTTIDTAEFTNPLEFLKKGKLEYGATIEDLYIELINSIPYVAGTREDALGDLETAPDQFEVFKVANRSAYYTEQLERQYPYTVHDNDLKRAFRSGQGFGSWVSGITKAQQTSEAYDDYRMTVALMARQIEAAKTANASNKFKGVVTLVTDFNALYRAGADDVPVTAATAMQDKQFLEYLANQIKKWSRRLTHLRKDLNIAGVHNSVPKSRQRLMMVDDIQADLDTGLLAWAFNPEKLDIGGYDGIDAWYSIGQGATGVSTPDDLGIKITNETGGTALAVLYDPEMLKIYNKVRVSDTSKNARGHYYNVFNTVGDIYAASPFHNFVVFELA